MLAELIQSMVESGAFSQLINDPLAQFGPPNDQFLFASLLPERQVPVNDYTEEGIRYRSVIANAGTRYSKPQKKGGAITGAFRVSLGNSDIAADLTGQDYDSLIRAQERFTGTQGTAGAIAARPSMAVMAQTIQWFDNSVTAPLLSHNELQRSQALVNAQIVLKGDDNYTETINLPNPTGARVAAGGTWSNDAYDPWPDIIARVNYLRKKGYKISRIITSTDVLTILQNNAKVKARAGVVSIVSGVVTGLPGSLSVEQLNALAAKDGIPPFESYDRVYFTSTSYGYYLARDVMLFVSLTGRDERIERGDLEPVVKPNVLGYTAIGRAAGQNAPGRVLPAPIVIENQKPPRVEAQGWQTSLAVVTDPEAVSVINTIS